MDKSKHTPGPWVYNGPVLGQHRVGARGCTVAEVIPQETADANARLIAAAPEMLDALRLARNLEGLCEWAVYKQEQIGGPLAGLDVRAHFKPIRDAIRKATGGE